MSPRIGKRCAVWTYPGWSLSQAGPHARRLHLGAWLGGGAKGEREIKTLTRAHMGKKREANKAVTGLLGKNKQD